MNGADRRGHLCSKPCLRLDEGDVHLDAIGNLIGILHGLEDKAPVVVGSHTDTVENGGKFDSLLGVVAGLEVASVYADPG